VDEEDDGDVRVVVAVAAVPEALELAVADRHGVGVLGHGQLAAQAERVAQDIVVEVVDGVADNVAADLSLQRPRRHGLDAD